jgi:hypothetical protein
MVWKGERIDLQFMYNAFKIDDSKQAGCNGSTRNKDKGDNPDKRGGIRYGRRRKISRERVGL